MCEHNGEINSIGPISQVIFSVGESRRKALVERGTQTPGEMVAEAYWDTGADAVVVDTQIIQNLEVPSFGVHRVLAMHELLFSPLYSLDIRIAFIGGADWVVADVPCINGPLRANYGYDALIGKTILDLVKFEYDGPNRRFKLIRLPDRGG